MDRTGGTHGTQGTTKMLNSGRQAESVLTQPELLEVGEEFRVGGARDAAQVCALPRCSNTVQLTTERWVSPRTMGNTGSRFIPAAAVRE